MPQYGFNLTNGQSCSDAGKLDLLDDEAARIEANLTACDLREAPGEDWSEWIIEVTRKGAACDHASYRASTKVRSCG